MMRRCLALLAPAIATAATLACNRADSTPPPAPPSQSSQTHLEMLTGGDRIAIVPFESHAVAERIAHATFQDSARAAEADLDRISPPEIHNNTALYSAVMDALPVLERERGSDRAVALVVFTDG